MITLPHTRTRRLSVRLTELTLGQAIAICKLPGERNELTTTELLRAIARDAEKPRDTYITSPLLWTVEERTLLTCIYLAHVTPDGPNFSVGNAKLSDYIDFNRDLTTDEIDLGEVAGKARVMRPLLGIHTQALEVLCGSRGEWIIGAMACCLYSPADTEPAPDWSEMSDMAAQAWVKARMDKLKELPESRFDALYEAYFRGAASMAHFVNIGFDDDGMVFTANGEGGAGAFAPARFPAISCVSDISRALS